MELSTSSCKSYSILFADDKIECRGTISTREAVVARGAGALPTWAGLDCTQATRATKASLANTGPQGPEGVTAGRVRIVAPSIL